MRPRKKRRLRDPLNLNLDQVDYKNVSQLRRSMSGYFRILPSKTLGTSSKIQRKLAREVKRARYMALLPYIRQ